MSSESTNASGNVETSPVKFMIVDDDQVSVMAIKRALKKLRILNPVFVASDGQEALDKLRSGTSDAEVAPPYLITLDLNMPRMDGFEFLEAVRKDPKLQHAIIFVLSTSDAPKDIMSAYGNNIAGYIVKDNLGESFVKALDMIDTYSKIVEMPH